MEKAPIKVQILKAAEEAFSQKGFQNSTVAEIATKAGIVDSVIYHHFKNKEDMLFSITGNYLHDALKMLDEHLAGILEPISRLSKMVWFHLYYNVTHMHYSRLLLFECRSNTNFYRHPSYQYIRQWSGIMLSILEQGTNLGVFREGLNMRVVRDIVIGALDLETISYLLGWKTEITSRHVQDLITPIRTMIEIETSVPEQVRDKYSLILRSAEKMFARKGYAQATIAEIAGLAGVSEGTVYEYFKNKEQLLLAIPKVRFQEHMESLRDAFKIKTPIRKLRRFMRYHFFLYISNPDFLPFYLINVRLNPKFYESEAYRIYTDYTGIIDQIFAEGKEDGSIKLSADPGVFKSLFFGGFAHMSLRWLMRDNRQGIDKTSELDEMVTLLVRAVRS